MAYIYNMKEVIADFMTVLIDRLNQLNIKDQRAIGQEFRELLNEFCRLEELCDIY